MTEFEEFGVGRLQTPSFLVITNENGPCSGPLGSVFDEVPRSVPSILPTHFRCHQTAIVTWCPYLWDL